MMNKAEAIAFMVQDGGATPGSRYGYWSEQCAEVSWQYYRRVIRPHAVVESDEDEQSWLDQGMGMTVNDSDEIEQSLNGYAISVSGADVDAMVDGYIDCQLWAQGDFEHSPDSEYHDCDDCAHGEFLSTFYGRDDISDDYVSRVREEIAGIVVNHPLAVRMFLNSGMFRSANSRERNEQFGMDFYLTREGHGAGFWDRGLGLLGDYLTTIAKYHGSADLLTDDGRGTLTA